MQIELLTQDHIDKLRLARSVTPLRYHLLIKRYKTAKIALQNIEYTAHIDKELQELSMHNISLCFYGEKDYPQALMILADAPAVLSLKGNKELLEQSMIGIVGSRHATLASRILTKQLAHELGLSGQVIVSGVAAGIDTQAHKGSLHTGTIGVLGCGLNIIYPLENAGLYDEIAKYGLLISEFSFNQPVKKESFPQRNRIIAGLCWGCVVIEASLKSGSLITAQCTIDQGKELFAVPGHPLDEASKGCNALLKDGAILIESANDILQYYNHTYHRRDMQIIHPNHELLEQHAGNDNEHTHNAVMKNAGNDDKVSNNTAASYDTAIYSNIDNTIILHHKNKHAEHELHRESAINIDLSKMHAYEEDADASQMPLETSDMLKASLKSRLIGLLSNTGITIHALQASLECDIHTLRSTLTELELNDQIYIDYKDEIFKKLQYK